MKRNKEAVNDIIQNTTAAMELTHGLIKSRNELG
jgi:hypothetical protein